MRQAPFDIWSCTLQIGDDDLGAQATSGEPSGEFEHEDRGATGTPNYSGEKDVHVAISPRHKPPRSERGQQQPRRALGGDMAPRTPDPT